MLKKNVLPMLRGYAKYIWLLLLAVVARAFIVFVAPVAVRGMLEGVALPAASPKTLIYYGAIFAGCFLLGYLINLVINHIYLRFSLNFKVRLNRVLYGQLFRMDYKAFQSREAAYFTGRIKQFVDQAFSLTGDSLPAGVVSVVTIMIAMAFIASVSKMLAVMAALLLPLHFFGYRSVNRKLQEKSAVYQRVCADNTKDIINITRNIESIKQLGNYPFFSELVGKYVENIERNTNEVGLYARNISVLMSFLVDLLKNGILLCSIGLLYMKRVSFPDVIFLNMIMSLYFSALSDLNRISLGLRDVLAGFDFVDEELASKTETGGGAELGRIERVSLQDGNFSYASGREVLRNFTLELDAGDKVAIVGKSGCGKSTLGRLLTRLYDADGISLNGRSAGEYSLESLRKKIHHVSQTPQLFPGTIEENITAGIGVPDRERLRRIVALPFMRELREGEDGRAFVGREGGGNLSGGQRQRITLARMLMHDPDVVVLDEATSALDSGSEESLLGSLEELCRGKILIYVSHRLSTVKKAGKIVVMKNGEVDSSGSFDELKNRGGEFSNIFAAQM